MRTWLVIIDLYSERLRIRLQQTIVLRSQGFVCIVARQSFEYSYLDVTKTGGTGTVARVSNLPGLTFSTIGGAPHNPVVSIAYCVTRIPEFWGDTCIGTVFKKFADLTVLNFVPDLRSKLEIVSAIIYRPRPIGLHENTGSSIRY